MDDETLPAADRSLGGELVMTVTAEVIRADEQQEDEGEQ